MKVKYKEKVYRVNKTPYCAYCDLNRSKCHVFCNYLCIQLGITEGFTLINYFDVL